MIRSKTTTKIISLLLPFFLVGLSLLPFAMVHRKEQQYLRRKEFSGMPQERTPVTSSKNSEYNSKAFVLLEMDGSRTSNNIVPTEEMIQTVNQTFVYAYDYVTHNNVQCHQDASFGAERSVVSATILDLLQYQ